MSDVQRASSKQFDQRGTAEFQGTEQDLEKGQRKDLIFLRKQNTNSDTFQRLTQNEPKPHVTSRMDELLNMPDEDLRQPSLKDQRHKSTFALYQKGVLQKSYSKVPNADEELKEDDASMRSPLMSPRKSQINQRGDSDNT